MPDYTRPNLEIPTALWGEVKVAAFRRGVKPVNVVVELLEKEFSAERVDLKRRADGLRKKVEEVLSVDPEPVYEPSKATPEPIEPASQTKPISCENRGYKHTWVPKSGGGMVCIKCGGEP